MSLVIFYVFYYEVALAIVVFLILMSEQNGWVVRVLRDAVSGISHVAFVLWHEHIERIAIIVIDMVLCWLFTSLFLCLFLYSFPFS